MTALAGVDVVQAKWRDLTAPEQVKAEVLLEEASALARDKVPGLDDLIATAAVDPVIVRKVITDAVIRVLANPTGVAQQSVGPSSASWVGVRALGTVVLTDAEIALLRPGSSGTSVVIAGTATGTVSLGAPRWLGHHRGYRC